MSVSRPPFLGNICGISIITQVIIEILALSLAENGGQIFKITASRFVNVSEEEVNVMNAIPRNTKNARKFGMTHFKGKI